jgi:uncharacterized protein YjdB
MRRIVIVGLGLALACGGSGGGTPDSGSQDAGMQDGGQIATRIAITPASPSLERGATLQLSGSVTDADGHVIEGAPLAWTVSNAGVASISSGGLATALGVGETDLVARSGAASGQAHLTVVVPLAASVQIVETSVAALASVGAAVQLHATALDVRGTAIPEAVFTWTSSAPGVATVDAHGLVTAAGNGSATIAATAGGFSATLAVQVAQQVASVTVSPATASVERGATAQLAASALDANGNAIADAQFLWTSDQPNFATVANGLVTAVAIGTATLHAASGGKSGTASVSVTIPAAASVAIAETNPAPLTFLGATLQLHASAIDARGAAIPEAVFTWSSGAPGVATVDTQGLVAAVANGPAQIAASSGGKSASLAISVSQTVATVAVSTPGGTPALLGAFNATVQLTAQASDSGGHALGGISFAWTSGDKNIASVDAASGLVTAHTNGSASITATASGHSGSATVAVLQQANSTSVLPATASIERGATQAFTASSADSNGNPVAGLTPVWTVDPGGVATIAQTGVATGQVVGATHVHGASGGHTGDAALTVVIPGVAAVTIAETAPASLDHFGQTFQLHANALDARGNLVPEAQINWSSSIVGVATISATGLITAVGDGQSIITASAGGKSSTLTIAVSQIVSTVIVSLHSGSSTPLAAIGRTAQLDATAKDSGGAAIANVSFTWAACDGAAISAGCTNNFATVSAAGLVTALANGNLIAQASAGGRSGALALQVAQAISTVTVTPPSDTIGNGDTRQFAAAAFDANSHPVAGAPAPTWASSKTALATISAAGLAAATTSTLAAADSTVITATFTVAAVPHSSTATLTVDPAIHAAARVTVTGSIGAGPFTAIGQTQALTAKAFDASSGQLSGLSFTWSSSDSTVVQVTPGAAGSPNATMTVIGDGSAMITASASGRDGTLAVSVAQQVSSLSAAGASTTLASVGATVKLIALDANAQAIPGGVTFVSCDGTASPPCSAATVADVSAAGLVSAKKNGSARIAAQTTLGGVVSTATLDIAVAQQVSQVTAQSSTTLASLGATVQLAALDANGNAVNPAGLVWSSSASGTASVSSSGLVTAAANGSATITALGPHDSGKTIGVVVAQAVTAVQTQNVGAATTLLSLNQTLQLKALDALGQVVVGAVFTACDGTAGPPCGNATVVSASGAGLITAKANGAARITARRASEAGATLDLLVSQQVASVTPATTTALSLNQTVQLFAFDALGSAIVSGVAFTSCDGTGAPPCAAPTVAFVNNSGTATTVANGSARITASTLLGAGSTVAHADLVVAQAIVQVAVRAAGSSTLTSLGQVQQLAGFDALGNIVVRPVSWASDANSVATVDSSGNVTAVAQGTAHLTATGPDSSTAELDIHVDQRVASVSTGGGSASLGAVGSTLQLQALDARGNSVVAPMTWFSDATARATVNATGLVTAVANGGANINASTSGDIGASLGITVAQKAASISPSSPATLTSLGATAQLSALDANGHAVTSGVTWSVCDNAGSPPCSPTVASINNNGLVVAQSNGTARATATSAGGSAFVSITVAQAISSVSVVPATASIGVRDTQVFTAVAKDSGGSVIPGATAASWASATPGIASIDASSGVATGVALGGPVTITATLSGFSGTAQLTVTPFTINWFFGEATPVGAASGTGANLTVHVGDRVQWKITDGGFHSSTSCGSANPPFGCTGGRQAFSWDDPTQGGGTLPAVTFTTVGTFSYCCTPHSCGQMMGTITVVP